MSGHSNIHPASEGTNRDLGGTDRHPNKTLASTQPPQQFEFDQDVDQDELEDHEGDRFFYEFDIEEEFRRLEMMKELEKRRLWTQHHQLNEEVVGDDEGEEEEGTTTPTGRPNDSHQETEDHWPAPWGSFDWRIGIAEYVLEYGQEEEEPLSPGRAAQVDQILFQSFPGIRKYYEEHPEEYSASLNSD